ncbi:hypothetical protein VCHA34P116_40022 [Vibrio chagasii]|nr:hypothetical protein VCHA32P90_200034 [Vibrio chagasii]CAH6912702.1 hypothetical protein VCHA35O137_30022 [Vibrio chagasii]CAH6939077.1 hypothetical protein VCHA34P116_40022 [Vibrio chagasii]CAH7131371.1 hypothetical protein VCHA39P230_200033 [Vibrio chagasii]CAH7147383.1 hypothetical protein VCHA53O469_200033 [Vibrio chagasii]
MWPKELAEWGGSVLTVDDLVEPVPMEACIDRAIASIELSKHQGLIATVIPQKNFI